MRQKRRRTGQARRIAGTLLLALTLALTLGLGQTAQGEPLGLAIGAFGGLGYDRGERLWLGGLLLEAGPLEGVSIRLGASLVRPPDGTLLRLETLVLLNFRLGAWVYLGGGIGVDRLTMSEGATMRFPLLAAAGLKTRPDPRIPWRFFVEGRALVPLPLQPLSTGERPIGFQFSAGVLLSF